jgi:hypothetical protein
MHPITKHAVDRFIQHWRADLQHTEARELLIRLVARSRATGIRTRPGNAWVHVTVTDHGEHICLVVRDDGAIVTVLDEAAGLTYGIQGVPHAEAEAMRAIERQRAGLLAWVETERDEQDRLKAARIVADAAAGVSVRPKALRRAKRLLGLAA